jgi:dephospho-CoA kinase
LIIGLCGYARVGKDTIADLMSEYTKLSFAAALKDNIQPLVEPLGIDLMKREDKEKVRSLLVEYGRTVRRLDQNYWVAYLAMKYLMCKQNGAKDFIVADVRYLNEAEWITREGGIIVRVERISIRAANDEELLSIRKIDNSGIKTHKLVNDLDHPERAVLRLRQIVKGLA